MKLHTCPNCQSRFVIEAYGPARHVTHTPCDSTDPVARAIAAWHSQLIRFNTLHVVLRAATDDNARYRAMMEHAIGKPRWQDDTGHARIRARVALLRADAPTLEALAETAGKTGLHGPEERQNAVENALHALESRPGYAPATDEASRRHALLCALARHAVSAVLLDAVDASATGFKPHLPPDADASTFVDEMLEHASRLRRLHRRVPRRITCPSCHAEYDRADPETAWRGSQKALDCATDIAILFGALPVEDATVAETRIRNLLLDGEESPDMNTPGFLCAWNAAKHVDGLIPVETLHTTLSNVIGPDESDLYAAVLKRIAKAYG